MTIFTAKGCGKCEKLRTFLKENNIAYEEQTADMNTLPADLIYLPIIKDNETWVQGLIPAKEYIVKNYLHR